MARGNRRILKNVFGMCRYAVRHTRYSVDQKGDFGGDIGIVGMEVSNSFHFANETARLAESQQRIAKRFGPPSADKVSQGSAICRWIATPGCDICQKYAHRFSPNPFGQISDSSPHEFGLRVQC